MPGWFSRQTEYAIPGVLLAVIIALLVLPPIWFLVQGSLYTTNADFTRGELTLDYYRRLIQEPRLFTSSLNSTVFAVGSSVVALLFGAMLAWVVGRTNAAFKTLAYLTTIISLGTPFILYVSAWLFLLGRAGADQRPLPPHHWQRRCADQRLLHERHDPGRGVSVVSAGLPAALGHLPHQQPGVMKKPRASAVPACGTRYGASP